MYHSPFILYILGSISIGYVLGCVSPAFVIGLIKGYDVRQSGTGNAGASNTVIMAGKRAGLFVALTDIFKAWLAWVLAGIAFPALSSASAIAGTSCILGHMYPVTLHFRGGKGLACLGGVILAYSPLVFFFLLLMALALALLLSYVSVVTVIMSAFFPAYLIFARGQLVIGLILLIPFPFITRKHRENFRRIRQGTEARFSMLWNREKEEARLLRAYKDEIPEHLLSAVRCVPIEDEEENGPEE